MRARVDLNSSILSEKKSKNRPVCKSIVGELHVPSEDTLREKNPLLNVI